MTLVTLNFMMCASFGIVIDGWTFSFWKWLLHQSCMVALSRMCMSSSTTSPCGMGTEPKTYLSGSVESPPGGGSTRRYTVAGRTFRLQHVMLLETRSQRTTRSVSEALSARSLVL